MRPYKKKKPNYNFAQALLAVVKGSPTHIENIGNNKSKHSGGISVKRKLIPDAQLGKIYQMRVVSMDEDEVHLSIVR